jgi:hypothetical protein
VVRAFHLISDAIAIEASLPHPLKFDSPRTIAGTAAGDHEETAAHLQVAYIVPIGRKLSAVIFGGPSFFTVKQSVGGIIRFSAAPTTFSLGDVDAGGALVGGGLRLRF